MITVFNNINLRERNSFGVDVVANELIEFSNSDDLKQLFTHTPPESWMVLSGGNNILFTRDCDYTLLTPTGCSIDIIGERGDDVYVRAEAGVEWDDVVEWCVERDLWGAENLSLIPGKAGAAPIQNIGAYGSEVCDILSSVEYFDVERGEVKILAGDECNFGYRESIFKRELKGRVIVTAIVLRLSKVAVPKLHYADLITRVEALGETTLRNIRNVVCEIRREKLPDTAVLGNAGSFFKNPIVDLDVAEHLKRLHPQMPVYEVADDPLKRKLAAGWLIDKAGMKGVQCGRVGVHSRQALVLVNLGGATGSEVLEFAMSVQSAVKKCFGVKIETEVNIL